MMGGGGEEEEAEGVELLLLSKHSLIYYALCVWVVQRNSWKS